MKCMLMKVIQVFYVPGIKHPELFFGLPPDIHNILLLANGIEVNILSGIAGIKSNIGELMLLHISSQFLMILAISMFTGISSHEWAVSRVKLLAKTGDPSNPGNWAPISQRNLFLKSLEKLVHEQVLKNLLKN